MYAAFERQLNMLKSETIVDVTYEELVANPVNTLENIYRHMDIPAFDTVQDAVKDYLDHNSVYQPNHFSITAGQQQALEQHWLPFMKKYGYPELNWHC
jgi:hypothetical protein